MRKFARFLLKLFGWKIDEHTPEGVRKCVVVMGPHTSNWDFIIGRLAFLLGERRIVCKIKNYHFSNYLEMFVK